jgi:hypothetical protein
VPAARLQVSSRTCDSALFQKTGGVLELLMLFLKAFLLAVTAAAATSSLMTYLRWMMTLSDAQQWLRDSFPVRFHFQHITELVGFPVVLWLFIAGGFFVPVFFAYLVAEQFHIRSVLYYLAGAVICACLTASVFVAGIMFGEANPSPMEVFLGALFNTLPACSAGALVFWWIGGRRVEAKRADGEGACVSR